MTAPAVREVKRNYCFACVRELVDKALGIRKP